MYVQFKDGTPLYYAVSVKRITMLVYGKEEQALQIRYMRNEQCLDTITPLNNVAQLRSANVGINGQTAAVAILPAREIYRQVGDISLPLSYLDISGTLGYSSEDTTSRRNAGFGNMYYGVEALIAPFGGFLGDNISLAFGGGLFAEGGRLRLPVLGHLRWTFAGKPRIEETSIFTPGPCQFGKPGDNALTIPSGYEIVPPSGDVDSTVYYMHEKVVIESPFKPFFFIEGGWIFNGFSEGAGGSPSLNSDDYAQPLGGAGLGTIFFKRFSASVAYRYMRLHLRTPCEACPPEVTGNPDNYWLLNTNEIHSAVLKLGYTIQ